MLSIICRSASFSTVNQRAFDVISSSIFNFQCVCDMQGEWWSLLYKFENKIMKLYHVSLWIRFQFDNKKEKKDTYRFVKRWKRKLRQPLLLKRLTISNKIRNWYICKTYRWSCLLSKRWHNMRRTVFKEMVYVGCKMPYDCKSKGHATADIFRRLNAYVWWQMVRLLQNSRLNCLY